MSRHGSIAAGLAVLLALSGAPESRAQEAGAAPQAMPPAVPPPPKPRPKPKPKPKPKPPAAPDSQAAPDVQAAPSQPDASGRAPAKAAPKAGKSEPGKPAAIVPAPSSPEAAPPPPASVLSEQDALSEASQPIACDPGKAVHYDGPNAFSLWVTRSGWVRVDNPLRPLTPVVTRIVQLVIGERVATAYGPDLSVLRRGGAPAALEATLGGPIQWDARLGNLPDPLAIVTDSGEPLAELRFKECGDAPAVKAVAVAKDKGKTKGRKGEKKAAREPSPPLAEQSVVPPPQKPAGPPPRRLPQGALPE